MYWLSELYFSRNGYTLIHQVRFIKRAKLNVINPLKGQIIYGLAALKKLVYKTGSIVKGPFAVILTTW